jgi:hypothetical protein
MADDHAVQLLQHRKIFRIVEHLRHGLSQVEGAGPIQIAQGEAALRPLDRFAQRRSCCLGSRHDWLS